MNTLSMPLIVSDIHQQSRASRRWRSFLGGSWTELWPLMISTMVLTIHGLCRPALVHISIATLSAWCPNSRIAPKSIGQGASSLLEDGPGVPKMSLALEQPQTCTGAALGLLESKRHFRDSWAIPPNRLLAPSPIDLGTIWEFGACTRPPGSEH